ncbi:hypothetical protein C8F04DRAFT_1233656 [Mycena alexandri]|uniref:DUF4419 domain-containing protein n=1 Tax=Mycena alexandri TaxID=1745969 RepID=A0AAD6SWL8_9AGAR|nr:hypothetical protein C8F04DRAFT_1233656 [Mycena alexandri]
MPVSFPVATHPAKSFPFPNGRDGYTAEETFATACVDQHTKSGEILQFSLPMGRDSDGSGRDFETKIPDIVPNPNGFVATLIDAYTQDRALVIRPDDVWLAILSQFNFFVNGRAELLRANFVAHEGKQELVIVVAEEGISRYTVDFADIARQLTGLVEKNVVDPTLRAWATPNFTTTTVNDTTVSAILLMATLKQYFKYISVLCGCGIPRVTLEGEQSDWVKILDRLEKLKEYGLETTAWYHLLCPVISRFVAAFEDPTSAENVDFWQRVAHYQPGGSGRGEYYTGWLTAFTVFNKEGRWMGPRLNLTVGLETAAEMLTAAQFWATYGIPNKPVTWDWEDPRDLVLDDTPYHRLHRGAIPPGYAEVDILVDDNGERFDCAMVAGSIGTRVSSALSASGEDDTVRPIAGWWLFVKDEKGMDKRSESAYSQIYGMERVC